MMLKTNIRQEAKAKSATRTATKNAAKTQKTQTKPTTTTTKRQMKPTTTKRTEANKIKYKLQQ